MTIKVNGQNRDVPEGTNILALLESFKLTPDKVAVEVNRRLVRTAQYANALKNGDEIEIVTFVGGG
jgi:thiamine biosynthesis protein ThiS